jgi:hypothetical protein
MSATDDPRQTRRQAATAKLWGEEAPPDTAAIQKEWAAWAANAKAHADANRTYFIARLNLGHTSAGYTSAPARESVTTDPAWIVQAIESAGWVLMDVGYVYQAVRERSHVLTDSAQIEGNIVGIYTFRRDLLPPGRPD